MTQKFLTRSEAAAFVKEHYGFCSASTLAAAATRGTGPVHRKFGQFTLYLPEDLIAWAESRIGAPRVSPRDPVGELTPAASKQEPPKKVLVRKRRAATAVAEASP